MVPAQCCRMAPHLLLGQLVPDPPSTSGVSLISHDCTTNFQLVEEHCRCRSMLSEVFLSHCAVLNLIYFVLPGCACQRHTYTQWFLIIGKDSRKIVAIHFQKWLWFSLVAFGRGPRCSQWTGENCPFDISRFPCATDHGFLLMGVPAWYSKQRGRADWDACSRRARVRQSQYRFAV